MSVQKILNEFGEKLVDDTRASYYKLQAAKSAKHGSIPNENSTLANSFEFIIKRKEGKTEFNLVMLPYWKWINNGRPKTLEGTKPGELKGSIEKWIKKKSISAVSIVDSFKPPLKTNKVRKKTTYPEAVKQLAFLISRKIHRVGYEGTFFLDNVLDDGRLELLAVDLREQLKTEIKINIIRGDNSTSNSPS